MNNNISKDILNKASLIFLRHPGQVFTRADIQNMLGVSKSTAFRVLTKLSRLINLEEQAEGQRIYYSLSEANAKEISTAIDLVLAVSDRERLALNFLLSRESSSSIFSSSVISLGNKLEKAGLLINQSDSIKEVIRSNQNINDNNEYIIDTLLTALETKTKITIEYKGAYSDNVKTHELYPVGFYLRDNNLYLYAYSPKHQDATSFAYSRIRRITLEYDKHYEIPSGISLDDVINDPFGIALAKPQRAVVYIYNKQVFYEKEKKWPVGTLLTDCPDGSLKIELTFSDPFAFRTWALSLGNDCYIESPDDIAEWVYHEHKNATERYAVRFGNQTPSSTTKNG